MSAVSLAPWTVLSQGSDLSFDQADLLDKFEYVVRNGRDLSPFLAADKLAELVGAHVLALASIKSMDGLKRVSKTFLSILSNDRSMPDQVLGTLDDSYFENFMRFFQTDCSLEVSASVANAMGTLVSCGKASDIESKAVAAQVTKFVNWMCEMLKDEKLSASDLAMVLVATGAFLRTNQNRVLFMESGGVPAVGHLLEKERYSQVQVEYHAVFTIWLLTFTGSDAQTDLIVKTMSEAEIPRKLTSILREVSAEKVVRITLAALRNLAEDKFGCNLRRDMIGTGLVAALEQLCLRRWTDGDIRDDLSALAEMLQTELQVMSTFDVYRSEVLSGALSWTPVHKDEVFWRENTEKMEQKNLELLRCLARSLHESPDPIILSVACHDLGMFIKHHERGRHIASSLGVKPRLMELMTDSDADVRRQALTCVQILMISHHDLMTVGRK